MGIFDDLATTEITRIHNRVTPNKSRVKRFATRGAAIKRTSEALKAAGDQVIRLKVDAETDSVPRRGHARERFEALKDGMTVNEYIALCDLKWGTRRARVGWDLKKNALLKLIAIGDE